MLESEKKEEVLIPIITARITPTKKAHAPKEFSCDLSAMIAKSLINY